MISDHNTILRWVTAFNTTGTVLMKRTNGRNRAIRTLENVDRVRLDTLRSPNHSVRLRAVALGINESSVRRILKIDLAFHPYKIQVCHQLLAGDYQQRINFVQFMIEIIDNNDNMVLFMSDETHFHLNGYVNKQNCHYWSPVNPQQLHEEPLHTPKVTVWCAKSATQIIGPYFIEDNGQTTTVNSERYIEMLTQLFFLNFNDDVSVLEKCGFNKTGQHHTQLVPQWRFFVKNSPDVSFHALVTFRGTLAPLTCHCVIFFVGSLKIKSLSIQATNPR
jgi:hypothetical protein|uniref:DUF4817 domain-containing protein n=1 Tax=Sipha flava TaxID=143950 RepID=A0A2S2QFU9_9HEMI